MTRRHKPKWMLATAIAWLMLVVPTSAQVQAITATHTYVLGDNDSRNDARQLCFLEVKRKVLEQAGVYIQSQTEVNNFQLTKNQITSYSAAVLSVETVKEEFSFTNGQNTLTLTVKAVVDMTDVKKRLSAIVADKSLQDRIAEQQEQMRRLEEQLQQVNAQLGKTPAGSSRELRKERNIVIGSIQELESIKLAALQRMKAEKENIRDLSSKIRQYIVQGMTESEVKAILGKPFEEKLVGSCYTPSFMCELSKVVLKSWYYGDLFVCFDAPLKAGDYRVLRTGDSRDCSAPAIECHGPFC